MRQEREPGPRRCGAYRPGEELGTDRPSKDLTGPWLAGLRDTQNRSGSKVRRADWREIGEAELHRPVPSRLYLHSGPPSLKVWFFFFNLPFYIHFLFLKHYFLEKVMCTWHKIQ